MKFGINETLKLALLMLCFSSFNVYAQWDNEGESDLSCTIPEIALVDIEPEWLNNITLTLTGSIEAGDAVSAQGASNNSLWINYTTSLEAGGNYRSVMVQIENGSIPSGVSLLLSASSYSGNGMGTLGTPTGPINVSGTPQTLISGIGGSYTGNGQGQGHRLNYSLSISDYNELSFNESATIQIAFTLTDN